MIFRVSSVFLPWLVFCSVSSVAMIAQLAPLAKAGRLS
jgi:hypothetical protein